MKTKTILLDWDTNEIGDIVLYLQIQTEDEQTEEARTIEKDEFLEDIGNEIENGCVIEEMPTFNPWKGYKGVEIKTPLDEINIDSEMVKEYCELKGIYF